MLQIEDIKKLLPHRYPFLLVDRVNEIAGEVITAQKNVTANEEFFNGHFPGAPIMPGVLQVESLAQAGGILLMSQQDNPQDYLMVFTGINNCKFRRQVVPGDVLVLEVKFTGRRRQFVQIKGKATGWNI